MTVQAARIRAALEKSAAIAASVQTQKLSDKADDAAALALPTLIADGPPATRADEKPREPAEFAERIPAPIALRELSLALSPETPELTAALAPEPVDLPESVPESSGTRKRVPFVVLCGAAILLIATSSVVLLRQRAPKPSGPPAP